MYTSDFQVYRLFAVKAQPQLYCHTDLQIWMQFMTKCPAQEPTDKVQEEGWNQTLPIEQRITVICL